MTIYKNKDLLLEFDPQDPNATEDYGLLVRSTGTVPANNLGNVHSIHDTNIATVMTVSINPNDPVVRLKKAEIETPNGTFLPHISDLQAMNDPEKSSTEREEIAKKYGVENPETAYRMGAGMLLWAKDNETGEPKLQLMQRGIFAPQHPSLLATHYGIVMTSPINAVTIEGTQEFCLVSVEKKDIRDAVSGAMLSVDALRPVALLPSGTIAPGARDFALKTANDEARQSLAIDRVKDMFKRAMGTDANFIVEKKPLVLQLQEYNSGIPKTLVHVEMFGGFAPYSVPAVTVVDKKQRMLEMGMEFMLDAPQDARLVRVDPEKFSMPDGSSDPAREQFSLSVDDLSRVGVILKLNKGKPTDEFVPAPTHVVDGLIREFGKMHGFVPAYDRMMPYLEKLRAQEPKEYEALVQQCKNDPHALKKTFNEILQRNLGIKGYINKETAFGRINPEKFNMP